MATEIDLFTALLEDFMISQKPMSDMALENKMHMGIGKSLDNLGFFD